MLFCRAGPSQAGAMECFLCPSVLPADGVLQKKDGRSNCATLHK